MQLSYEKQNGMPNRKKGASPPLPSITYRVAWEQNKRPSTEATYTFVCKSLISHDRNIPLYVV